MLIIHILIALSTVGLSGMSLVSPSRKKIISSYFLTAATFASGSYLIIMSPSHLVSACVTGLVFLGVVGGLLFVANHRMSSVSSSS